MAKRISFPVKVDRWDSNFFKTRIARLVIRCREKDKTFYKKLEKTIRGAKEKGVKFFVVKLEEPKRSYIRDLLMAGFRQCGESVDMVFKCSKNRKKSNVGYFNIRPFTKKDDVAISEIAKDAFRKSYLYKIGFGDTEDVDRYHIRWVRNLTKPKDSYLLVAEYKKKVIGFIAVKIDKEKQAARIVLIAVHKDFRGMGAANALVNRCLLLSAKLRNVYVKTQRENIAAISLYKKMGFKVFKHDRIFCKKIEG